MSLQNYNDCICVHCFLDIDDWFALHGGLLVELHEKSVGWMGLGVTPLVLDQHPVNQLPEICMDDFGLINWELKTSQQHDCLH